VSLLSRSPGVVPGEMRLYREREFEQAKTWLAE
jgi:hypothetical protein